MFRFIPILQYLFLLNLSLKKESTTETNPIQFFSIYPTKQITIFDRFNKTGVSLSKSHALQELNNQRKSKASPNKHQPKEDVLNKQKNNPKINQSGKPVIQIGIKQGTKSLQLETDKNDQYFPQIKKTQTNFMKKMLINESELKKRLSQTDIQGHIFDSSINQDKENFHNIHKYQTTFQNNKNIHRSHHSNNQNKNSFQHTSPKIIFKAVSNSSNKIQTDKFIKKKISQNIQYENSQSFNGQNVFQKDNKCRFNQTKIQQNKRYEKRKSKTTDLQVWDIGIEGEQKIDNDERPLMLVKGIILSNKFSENQQHFSEDQQFLKLPPLQLKRQLLNTNHKQGGLKAISLRQYPQSSQPSQISERKNHAPFI